MKLNIQLFAYTKKEWKDLPSKDTPILAADLNNIENGIATAVSPDEYYGKTEIDDKENNLKAENEYLNSVIEQAFTPVEKEGTSINYDNTINARFKDIKLCGDTTQNGTPTPDTPVPVNVVTGDNTINIFGKNLFNKNTITTSAYLKEDGTLQTGTSVDYNTSDFIPIQPNTAYYKTETGSPRGKYYDANKQPLNTTTYQDIPIGNLEGTFTTPNNAHYLRITINTSIISLDNVMIHKGSEATSQSYAVNLGSIELCKIGDYQDYIHKDNGKWYLEKQIGKVVLNGSERIIPVNDFTRYNVMSIDNVLEGSINNPNVICNCYNSNFSLDNFNIFSSGDAFLSIMDNRFKALADFKNWLSTNNVIVNYVLKTPTNTEITDTTLLEQLEELAGAKTYAGETNIVATSDGLTIIPKTTALTK